MSSDRKLPKCDDLQIKSRSSFTSCPYKKGEYKMSAKRLDTNRSLRIQKHSSNPFSSSTVGKLSKKIADETVEEEDGEEEVGVNCVPIEEYKIKVSIESVRRKSQISKEFHFPSSPPHLISYSEQSNNYIPISQKDSDDTIVQCQGCTQLEVECERERKIQRRLIHSRPLSLSFSAGGGLRKSMKQTLLAPKLKGNLPLFQAKSTSRLSSDSQNLHSKEAEEFNYGDTLEKIEIEDDLLSDISSSVEEKSELEEVLVVTQF